MNIYIYMLHLDWCICQLIGSLAHTFIKTHVSWHHEICLRHILSGVTDTQEISKQSMGNIGFYAIGNNYVYIQLHLCICI